MLFILQVRGANLKRWKMVNFSLHISQISHHQSLLYAEFCTHTLTIGAKPQCYFYRINFYLRLQNELPTHNSDCAQRDHNRDAAARNPSRRFALRAYKSFIGATEIFPSQPRHRLLTNISQIRKIQPIDGVVEKAARVKGSRKLKDSSPACEWYSKRPTHLSPPDFVYYPDCRKPDCGWRELQLCCRAKENDLELLTLFNFNKSHLSPVRLIRSCASGEWLCAHSIMKDLERILVRLLEENFHVTRTPSGAVHESLPLAFDKLIPYFIFRSSHSF